MTPTLKTYPKYKNSGVDWLRNVPSDWDVFPFKKIFKLSNERVEDTPSLNSALSVSGYRGVEPRDIESMEGQMPSEDISKYRIVRKGQLAVNTMWLNYSGLGVSDYEGYISPAYRAYNIDKIVNKKFVHHLLRSPLYIQKYSSLLYGLRPNSLQVKNDDFEKIEILVPPLETQKNIADFLDEKTKVIDELVAKKEKMIELLREKRVALITHAVTKGLDPKTKMKLSGIDWLGGVPIEWKKLPLKFLFSYQSGGVWGDEARNDANDLICVRVADFDFVEFIAQSSDFTYRNLPDIKKWLLLDVNSILLEKSGGGDQQPVGRTVRYLGKEKATCSNFIQKLQVDKKYNSEFVILLLSALYFNGVTLKVIKKTTGIQNLDLPAFLRTDVFLPSKNEQKQIVDFVNINSANIIDSIKKMNQQIDQLKEYRSSLIYSAVTGKIKV